MPIAEFQPRMAFSGSTASSTTIHLLGKFIPDNNNASAPIVAHYVLDMPHNIPVPLDTLPWRAEDAWMPASSSPCSQSVDPTLGGVALEANSIPPPSSPVSNPSTSTASSPSGQSFWSAQDRPVTQTIYLSDNAKGLTIFNTETKTCQEVASAVARTSASSNRTLIGYGANPTSTQMVGYGGIDTDPATGKVTVVQELQVVDTRYGRWTSIFNNNTASAGGPATLPPAVFSPIVFAANPTQHDTQPTNADSQKFFMVGGCTESSAALNPKDTTGCLAMDTVYEMSVVTVPGSSADGGGQTTFTSEFKKVDASSSLPPIVRSPCSTFIPGRGLFVAGGYNNSGQGSGEMWLLDIASFKWSQIQPKLLTQSRIPQTGHQCRYMNGQILFIGDGSTPLPSTTFSNTAPRLAALNVEDWTESNSLHYIGNISDGNSSSHNTLIVAICSVVAVSAMILVGFGYRFLYRKRLQKVKEFQLEENQIQAYEEGVLNESDFSLGSGGPTSILSVDSTAPFVDAAGTSHDSPRSSRGLSMSEIMTHSMASVNDLPAYSATRPSIPVAVLLGAAARRSSGLNSASSPVSPISPSSQQPQCASTMTLSEMAYADPPLPSYDEVAPQSAGQ